MPPVDAYKGNCLSPTKVGKFEYVDSTRTKPNEVPCLGGALAKEGCPGVYTRAGSANDGLAITATDIEYDTFDGICRTVTATRYYTLPFLTRHQSVPALRG